MTRSSVLFQFDQGSDRSPRAGIEPRETKLDKLQSERREDIRGLLDRLK
jgi:hypothetical protein